MVGVQVRRVLTEDVAEMVVLVFFCGGHHRARYWPGLLVGRWKSTELEVLVEVLIYRNPVHCSPRKMRWMLGEGRGKNVVHFIENACGPSRLGKILLILVYVCQFFFIGQCCSVPSEPQVPVAVTSFSRINCALLPSRRTHVGTLLHQGGTIFLAIPPGPYRISDGEIHVLPRRSVYWCSARSVRWAPPNAVHYMPFILSRPALFYCTLLLEMFIHPSPLSLRTPPLPTPIDK